MKCLAPLLFNAPYEHVHSLHKLYVDSIVNHLDWRTFVQKLNAEMQDFNLLVGFFPVSDMHISLTRKRLGDSAPECERRILGDSKRRSWCWTLSITGRELHICYIKFWEHAAWREACEKKPCAGSRHG